MRYPNGEIPKSELVYLGGEHWLTPATAARWSALQQDVYENEGVWLQITRGPNAYRDLDSQWHTYDNEPPGNAAYPGTSSHGGELNGRDSMAIDVGNWGLIGMDKFYAYARKHGFEPGYFDWEPWHIIDWNPWDSSGTATPTSEEDYVIDSMYAVVDGVPSWCWINDANGKVKAVHTQADANWVSSYMGSVRRNFSSDLDGGTSRYLSRLKFAEEMS